MKKYSRDFEKFGLKNASDIPSEDELNFGAGYGLINLQSYHDLDPLVLSRGQIQNPLDGKVYQSRAGLGPNELLTISETAKKVSKKEFNLKDFFIFKYFSFGCWTSKLCG